MSVGLFVIVVGNHDHLAGAILAITAALVLLPYLMIRGLLAVDAWLDDRYRRESPEAAKWEQRRPSGVFDLRDGDHR